MAIEAEPIGAGSQMQVRPVEKAACRVIAAQLDRAIGGASANLCVLEAIEQRPVQITERS